MTLPAAISVVIPCFNAERYIEASVRSVLAQGWPGLEVVVVDDGSTDRSAERVAAAFDAAQVKLVRQPNRGVAAARNEGIRQANGDWIAFLDADDLWLPGKLQAQWAQLSNAPDAAMSYCAWAVWTSDEPVPSTDELNRLTAGADDESRWRGASGWIYPQLLLDCEVWTSTVLARKSLFAQIGGFDVDLRVGEDYDLWLRASRVSPILRVSRPYALYRQHPASITRSVPAANYRGIVVGRAVERYGYASPDGRSARKADVKRALARSWSEFAAAHLDAGDLDIARQGSLQSLRNDCSHAGGWKVLVKGMAKSIAGTSRPRTA